MGSYIPLTRVLPSGTPLRLALGKRPILPGITLASSLMISPNRLLVTTIPFRLRGSRTISMAAESMSWCPTSSSGNSFSITSETTFRQSRLVASTLALSRLQTLAGGDCCRARCPASRVMRSTSAREYGSVSQASPSPSSSLRCPKYMPPVSSRTIVKSTPRQTSALSGERSTRESEAKLHGRRLPKAESDLRSFRRPCSGRTAPVPHF